jgi:N6-adenosine-specific RNA methylase IME4
MGKDNGVWPFADLRMFSYDVIVCDPPWLMELRSVKGEGKSPQAQYECMSNEAILQLPVGDLIGSEGWLFLWTSAPKLDLGFDCLKRWGFTYTSRLSWLKITAKNRKRRMGPGYVVRTFHEDILIGKIGEPRLRKALPSLFDGVAREHSRKPDEFYDLIDKFAAPGARKLDLFSRQTRPGWTSYGDERTKFDEVAA